mmetsp:Transcript_178656/g.566909  ORF Transcript_178656/g.566909 Transcript_178656/m.566909 type:complete len:529 (-) Transcript_178656:487-2073(-)
MASSRVTTLAGSSESGFVDGRGDVARFKTPCGVAVSDDGSIFVADFGNHCIRKGSPDGVVSTWVGSAAGFADGQGNVARFKHPSGIAVNKHGAVFVADTKNNCIRKVTPDGVVSTLAGCVHSGFVDGHASEARFHRPTALTVDDDDNVYVADKRNFRIRKITAEGIVSTIAGSGVQGFADGSAGTAMFKSLGGVTIDPLGNLFVADHGNARIRKITPGGVVSTLAGSGLQGDADDSRDDGEAHVASFEFPVGLAISDHGDLFVSDVTRIRKISSDGMVSTVVGSGTSGFAHNTLDLFGMACDGDGNLVVVDGNRIRLVRIVAPSRPSSLQLDMGRMLEDPMFCDVTFSVGGERIGAHRGVLAARSEYFLTMFASGFREGDPNVDVEVQGVSPAAFKCLLKFLYSDTLSIDDENAVHLMHLAHRYGLSKLYRRCESHVKRTMTASNCIGLFLGAHEVGLERLRQHSLAAVAKHLQSNDIQHEAPQTLQQLTSHPELMAEVLTHYSDPTRGVARTARRSSPYPPNLADRR